MPRSEGTPKAKKGGTTTAQSISQQKKSAARAEKRAQDEADSEQETSSIAETPKKAVKSKKTVPGSAAKKKVATAPSTPRHRAIGGPVSQSPARKRRYRPGIRALLDIRKYQKSTDLLLRKLPFARLVRLT
jgi:hypothetical protein